MKKHIARIAAAVLACAGVMGLSPEASAEKSHTISVTPGADGYVTVTVRLDQNTGITTYGAWIGFDNTSLEFVSAEDTGAVFGSDTYFLGELTEDGKEVALLWVDGNNDVSETGNLATLKFRPLTSGSTVLTVKTDSSLVVDTSGNVQSTAADEQNVSVWSGRIGDVNGDGSFNRRDFAVMSQYFSGWDEVGFYDANADINGDGVVNRRDFALMSQYFSGWDVPDLD